MKEKTSLFFNVDTLIIIAIALCMIFLNTFTVNKLDELQKATNDAIFVKGDMEFGDEEQFAEEVVNYLPDTYKMIELYDENLELGFQIQFNDDQIPKADITQYPNIVSILQNNDEGQTRVDIGGVEQDVYFKWLTNNGERRLLIVYSAIRPVSGLWIFSLVCYIVLFLVFILFLRLKINSFKRNIRRYASTTRQIRTDMYL